jgi:hypothetical protein
LHKVLVLSEWRATADEDGHYSSPWRYEAIADYALQPTNPQLPAILRYASWAAVFSISRVVRLPFDCGHFD